MVPDQALPGSQKNPTWDAVVAVENVPWKVNHVPLGVVVPIVESCADW